jgi:hypothetical protein
MHMIGVPTQTSTLQPVGALFLGCQMRLLGTRGCIATETTFPNTPIRTEQELDYFGKFKGIKTRGPFTCSR